jgi:hypothetical protein
MKALRERLHCAKKHCVNYPETGRFETFRKRKEKGAGRLPGASSENR